MSRVTQVDPIFAVFKDMVQKRQLNTKRKCLKCHKEFTSRASGHRLCADCNAENNTPTARTFSAIKDTFG